MYVGPYVKYPLFFSDKRVLTNLTFKGPCIFKVISKYNQQDATLYNILYYYQCSHMLQANSPPIIRSSKTVQTTSGTCQARMLLPLAVAARKLDMTPSLTTLGDQKCINMNHRKSKNLRLLILFTSIFCLLQR